MEDSKEIATQEVSPIAFDNVREKIRGGLEVRSPNTKFGQGLLTGLAVAAVATIAYLGVYLPLAVHMPANKAELARRVAIGSSQAVLIEDNIIGDWVWGIFGTIFSGAASIRSILHLKKRRSDLYRLAASLPGSTHAFLTENEERTAGLEARCTDFDRRLKAFVDGKQAFTGLEEQFQAAMAQFVSERTVLDAEAAAYLEGLREAVATDRRRLKFVDDCRALADIRQKLAQSPTNVYRGDTRHVSQGVAGAALALRLEHEQEEVGMPKRFLTNV